MGSIKSMTHRKEIPQRGESDVIWPQAIELWQLPEAGRMDSPIELSKGI